MSRACIPVARRRPGQALMIRRRLAEAVALLDGDAAAAAAQPLVDQWLADVARGWVPPPQMALPLRPSR